MKVLLSGFGTHGDLRPLVALAVAIRAAGGGATLCGPPDHAALAAAWGVPYVPAGEPYGALMAELERGPRAVFAVMARQVPAQFAVLDPLVAEADVVVSGSMEYATASLAEAHGRPRRAVFFSPAFVPADGQAMPLLGLFGAPTWVNRATWWVSDQLSGASIGALITKERDARGLGRVDGWAAHLCGAEVWVPFPTPLGQVVGARVPVRPMAPWMLPGRGLSPALAAWLDAGPPPVYIGLGSMPEPGATAVFRAAAARVGRRLVLVAPDAGAASDAVYVPEGEVDHRALFPRCAVVVHHGGAGTTIAALGRPQVILPKVADQHAHARWLASAGVGVAVARRALTAERLAQAIERALTLRVSGGADDGAADAVALLAALRAERATP